MNVDSYTYAIVRIAHYGTQAAACTLNDEEPIRIGPCVRASVGVRRASCTGSYCVRGMRDPSSHSAQTRVQRLSLGREEEPGHGSVASRRRSGRCGWKGEAARGGAGPSLRDPARVHRASRVGACVSRSRHLPGGWRSRRGEGLSLQPGEGRGCSGGCVGRCGCSLR